MNTVDISVEDSIDHQWINSVEAFVLACLNILKRDDWEVSILICSETLMADYNQSYRGKEGATDVLSFPQIDDPMDIPESGVFIAGDIALCPAVVAQNAKEFGVSYHEELGRVLVHGLLHLSGFDHQSNQSSEPMLQEQELILGELKVQGSIIK